MDRERNTYFDKKGWRFFIVFQVVRFFVAPFVKKSLRIHSSN